MDLHHSIFFSLSPSPNAAKTVMQQGSTESLNDAPLTDKAGPESAKGPSDLVIELETRMKILMQTTGGTSPADLLERFTAQKEAMQRLNYLRTVTESEKRHLEIERDELTSQLEQLKFSDTKENEVYVMINHPNFNKKRLCSR